MKHYFSTVLFIALSVPTLASGATPDGVPFALEDSDGSHTIWTVPSLGAATDRNSRAGSLQLRWLARGPFASRPSG